MTHFDWLEWFGYIASVVVAISLLMGTIVRLRTYNLVGSLLFSIYGFLIGSLPVGFLNGFIALINIYYLIKIHRRKEYFRVIPLSLPSPYLMAFVDFYRHEIQEFFPGFSNVPDDAKFNFAVLRNMAVAAVFVGRDLGDGTVEILVDYAIPEYRDLKPGMHIFIEDTSFFVSRGINKLICSNYSQGHMKYLKRLDFKEEKVGDSVRFVKQLA